MQTAELNHVILTISSEEALSTLAQKLQAMGVQTNRIETCHTGNKYVAFRDPDNIQLEYWLPRSGGA